MRSGYILILSRLHQRLLTTNCSGDDVNTVILSAVENCAGVISGCLPTLLPIWQYFRHGRSPMSMRQSIQNSTPRQRGETKSSSIKALFWPESRPREEETRGNGTAGGSFKRLGESVNESYPMKNIKSSALTESMPSGGANTIRITTDLRQTDMAAPHEDKQSAKPSEC